MKHNLRRFGCAAAVACAGGVIGGVTPTTQAEVKLPRILGSNMVIQCDAPVNIWGTADAGEDVSVTLAGQEPLRTTAGADGKWLVKLPPQKAGATLSMTVQGKNTIQLDNILVGEVWVCSGQSNMAFTLESSQGGAEEVARANHPQLRIFRVPSKTSTEIRDDIDGGKWEVCTPESIKFFSAVGYYFGRDIMDKQHVPVGLIGDFYAGTPAESWVSQAALQTDPDYDAFVQRNENYAKVDYPRQLERYEKTALPKWQEEADQAKAVGKKAPPKPEAPEKPEVYRRMAMRIYNAMIHPVVHYTIRGALWYQGEGNANANRSYQYRRLLPLLITSWRDEWGQGNFPFAVVQLPGNQPRAADPVDDAWAELREAQLMTVQNVPNTGLVVTLDVGEKDGNLHPANKKPVGARLALWALATVYGHDIPYSGPIYRSMEIDGGNAVLRFDHTNDGLKTNDGAPLTGFALAGSDHKFVWADAKIDGNKVVVHSDQVPQPVAVRYAWARNPAGNLANGADLPAAPFRSDDWPGVTVDNK